MKGTIQFILLLLFSHCLSTSKTFTPPLCRPHPSQRRSRIPSCIYRTTSVELQMGLKSFIKGRFKKVKDDDDSSTEKKKEPTPIPPPAPIAEEKVVESPFFPPSPPHEVIYEEESIEDRIARVKKGDMTEEEKQRFLLNTLNRSSYFAGSGDKPIRQRVPSTSTELSKEEQDETKKPAPFPKDSLWNAVIGGKRYEEKAGGRRDLLLEDAEEVKKREWYDMVMDPNRFQSFRSYSRSGKAPSTDVSPVKPQLEEEEVGWEDATDEDPSTLQDQVEEPPIAKQPPSSPPTTKPPSSPPTTKPPSTLGSRLERAAVHQTHHENERKRHLEKQRLESQKQLAEDRRHLSELRRQREQAALKKEADIKAKRQAEKEELRKQAELRRKEEEERLKILQERQDAYWAKKLQSEQAMKEARMTEEERAKNEFQRKKDEEVQRARLKKEEQERFLRDRTREEERAREDPREDAVLKEAEISKERAREMARQTLEASAAKALAEARKTLAIDPKQKQQQTTDWNQLKQKSMPEAAPSPRLDLRDLTRGKSPPATAPPSGTRLDLRNLTRLQPNPAPASKPTLPKSTPPKGPIRMRISADEEDEDDPPTPSSEVPEDAKKRANMWGINLDLLKGD